VILSIGYAIVGLITITMFIMSQYTPDARAGYKGSELVSKVWSLVIGFCLALGWSVLYWATRFVMILFHFL
jgi:hypothetical protein